MAATLTTLPQETTRKHHTLQTIRDILQAMHFERLVRASSWESTLVILAFHHPTSIASGHFGLFERRDVKSGIAARSVGHANGVDVVGIPFEVEGRHDVDGFGDCASAGA